MNKVTVWGVVVAVAVIIVGLLAWRVAGPDVQLVPTATLQPLAATPVFVPAQDLQPTAVLSPLPGIVTSPGLGSPSPGAGTTQSGATIFITDSGFSPASVTVSAGSTVTFVNDGQAMHWPASDVHPTHQVLPGFDAKRGLSTGETYSFTFAKAGSWACHDHLNPTFRCTITVQ